MDSIGEKDEVVALDVPEPDNNEPLPIVLAKNGVVVFSYMTYVARHDMVCIVSFPTCYAHSFAPWKPSDHRMKSGGGYEVKNSAWARRFGAKARHFVFVSKDGVLECAADDYGIELGEESRRAWKDVTSIEEIPQGIEFVYKPLGSLIVRNRAFKTPGERKKFLELARRYSVIRA